MATGKVILWRTGDKSGRYFGFIADNALGENPPRDLNAIFDERNLVCSTDKIERGTRVSFDYDFAAPSPGKNPRALHVRPLPLQEVVGSVVRVKNHDRGWYGFAHADGNTRDFYFSDRSLNSSTPPLDGQRVRFWYYDGDTRAARVELVEEE